MVSKCERECVDVDQWTEIMMSSSVKLVDTEEIAAKIFYFIIFKGGKGQKDGEKLVMSVQDFEQFVSDGTFDEYYPDFARFIRLCWKKIDIGTLW